ncbi:hypothetical protein G4X40_11320 [Rhodococcus sp. D2-41]|uniref:Rv1733c family protein n=1 Tax=Speluncibacter jeojiensis TaxID=2710754 RepID=UPI00240EB4AB|nr:hypothetical protein [Rhodococcus sp. D2-41]MDG3010738.1 hypothetical protein [Rhodococcus sp. D2-41]
MHSIRYRITRRPAGAMTGAALWLRVQWVRLAGSSPLVRRGDRLAAWLVLVALAAAVLAVPAAVGIGRIAEQRALVLAQHELRTRHRVPVTTLAAASHPLASPDPGAVTVLARWFWRGHHSGSVAVPAGTGRGSHLTRWVDEQGRLTGAPMTIAEARSTTARVAFAAWGCFVGALLLLGRGVGRRLARSQEARWDRDLKRLVRTEGR